MISAMNISSSKLLPTMHSPQSASAMPTASLALVVEQIFQARRITRDHQQLMMQLLEADALNDQDQALINRVYEGLRKGLLRVA